MYRLLLALLCLGTSTQVLASCPASNQYSFSFTTATAATLSYANSYTYTATNGNSQSQNFVVSFNTYNMSSTILAGNQMPAINNLINDGGTTNNNLVVGGIFSGRTTSISANSNVAVINFTFATPIRDFSVQVNDIDYTFNQFRDWVQVTGSNGASVYTPSVTTPTGVTLNEEVGPATAPFNIPAGQVIGTGSNPNSGTGANTSTIYATFPQPVTAVSVRYGNYPYQTGENTTGQQAIGIQSISFCPTPALTVSKTVAPYNAAAPQNIPGADVLYTISVTNSNSSPVDSSALAITDPLPSNLSLYNAAATFNAGTSGLTFSSANESYSNNGGVSFTYTPTGTYDPAVNAVRIAPQGSMPANSTFSVTFRAQIK